MKEPSKETVIIVHGTWAAPKDGERRWYQPVDSAAAADGFVTKLDAALQKRGSSARCWAHCTQHKEPFHWSGDNSWIARTEAASALADYVTELQSQGWRCHIIAHSHGGNVVLEALPQIAATTHFKGRPGKITTLGTPFIDTKGPIIRQREEARSLRRKILILAYFALFFAVGALLLSILEDGIYSFVFNPYGFLYLTPIPILIGLVVYAKRPQSFGNASLDDIMSWPKPWNVFRRRISSPGAGINLHVLCIGSRMDEAWQILHHMRGIDNPLAVSMKLRSYLLSSLRLRMSLAIKTDAILGAQSFGDVSIVGKLLLVLSSIIFGLFFVLAGATLSARNWLEIIGVVLAMYLYALVARQTRLIGAVLSVPTDIVTYFVRDKGWPVLVALAMGLEGYRFELPSIESFPKSDHLLVTYEDMPIGAVQRALRKRNAWINGHLGDFSMTFSKLAVTTADIKSLLRTVESDQTLVHAAYYTDDQCIARIANWIAGKTSPTG